MFWNFKRISHSLLLLLVAMQGGLSFAASLEENSPFIPFDYVSGQAELPLAPSKGVVELRGILDFGDAPRFSLFNAKTQKSIWVNFKDKEAPYYIDSYDPKKKLVAITVNGVRQQLQVSKPSDEPAQGGAASRGLTNVPSMDDADDEEVDDEEEDEVDEDEQAQKRREMSEKVYKAFQQYVSEKRGEAGS